MHNNYMSKETIDSLKPGDRVTVRMLEDLEHDFGFDIPPCGWNSDMDEYCGETLTVAVVYLGQGKEPTVIKVEENSWSYCREMFEPNISAPAPSNEEMAAMWEKMILGENANNEK